MRITAVITCYNYAHVLDRSAVSALNQSEPCEVVVVDDGSADDPRGVVERLQRHYAARELRYLRIANAGPSAARNAGAHAARGDWLAFLDADDYWYPHKLAAQRWFAARRRDADLVFAGVDIEDDDGYRRRRLPPREGPVGVPELLRENLVPSPTPLVRRAAFFAAGAFDERRRHGEDWDLWLRLAEQGAIYAQRAALACYRDHAGGLHRTPAMAAGSHAVLEAALARNAIAPALAARARAALDADTALAAAHRGAAAQAAAAGLTALTRAPRLAPHLVAGLVAAALARARA